MYEYNKQKLLQNGLETDGKWHEIFRYKSKRVTGGNRQTRVQRIFDLFTWTSLFLHSQGWSSFGEWKI